MDEAKESSQPKKKMKWWQKTLIWIGGVFVLLIVIGIIGSRDKSTNTNTASGKNTNQQVYAVNQDVRVGDIRWKLLSARDHGSVLKGSESKYPTYESDKTTTGRFIEINMEVENLGTDQTSGTTMELVDSKGRTFSSGPFTSWITDEQSLIITTLNPNITKQYKDIYEVPTDATGLKVKVSDLNIFGNKEAFISLGI